MHAVQQRLHASAWFVNHFAADVDPTKARGNLFAKHERCLASTDEGFEDAAATFPRRGLCQ